MRHFAILLLLLLVFGAATLFGCACDCASPAFDLQVRKADGSAPSTLTGTIGGVDFDCDGDCSRAFTRDGAFTADGDVLVDLTDGTESFAGAVALSTEDGGCCPNYLGDVTLN